MASQRPPDPVQHHRDAQTALTVALAALIKQLWDSLFPSGVPTPDLLPTFKARATAVVQQGALAAQAIGQELYDSNRTNQGVAGRVRLPLVPVPTEAQVGALVDKGLSGLAEVAHDSPILPSDLVANALTNVTGQLDLAVVDAGRDATEKAVASDRGALGFVRVPKPGACAFCMLMATRGGKGIFYKSRETAGEVNGSTLWGPDAKGTANRYHAGCHCEVVAVYSRSWEPPQHVKDAIDVYDSEYVQGHRGKGRANAFRREYERPHIDRETPAPSTSVTALSRADIEQQLAVIHSLPDSDYKKNQTARLEQALAAAA